jgi:streptogramin lyase
MSWHAKGLLGTATALVVMAVLGGSAGAARPTITSYPAAPSSYGLPVVAEQLITGPDGNVWYTDSSSNLWRMTIGSHQVTQFPVMGTNPSTNGLVSAYGGVWFTDETNGGIGCVTPDGSQNASFRSVEQDTLDAITLGPDGNLWFVDSSGESIGRVIPSRTSPCALGAGAASIAEFPIGGGLVLANTENGQSPVATNVDDIASGPNGDLWFTITGSQKIGVMNTSGQMVAVSQPLNGYPFGIVKGPDGNMWFTEVGSMQGWVGRISGLFSAVTQFPAPQPMSPSDIVAGPDGNLWFGSDQGVGCITPSGQTARFVVPGEGAYGLAVGSDRAIWFTEGLTDGIGRLASAVCGARASATCSTSHLRLAFQRGLGTLGHRELDLSLRNAGLAACTLTGYPRVWLLNRHGRVLVAAKRAPGYAVGTVTLAPGRRGFFTVIYAASGPCLPHYFVAYGFRVTPPGGAGSRGLHRGPLDVCAVHIGGRPEVTPVRARLNGG